MALTGNVLDFYYLATIVIGDGTNDNAFDKTGDS
jgi:hypothetical protein